ncbi:hypothetical protein HID58_027088 [Brassica napus]|uniref:C2 domain-containing protein n=1 Tax=Brassica napus TaxID=3708 RepID=A0ABQ8CQZ7_BRANA|nr:hypothetical protein HID58_027088 [Brassica napus]
MPHKEGYVMCEKCEGRKNPKESKGAAMKSVIRKQRMDLSILFLEVLIESTSMFLVKLSYLSSNNVQFYKLYQIQDKQLGVMRVHVKRGINLAIRDSTTSDPYVVVTLANQKVKTRVINSNCNPVWDEQLALTIKDVTDPIRMTVYDKDRFSGDDKMGDAEIDMRPFLEAHQMELDFQKLPNGCAIKRIRPGRTNCLAEESSITWSNGKIIQDMILRLRNVECGELEIMLELADGPGCKGLGREDRFSGDDKMGNAEIDLRPFVEAHQMELDLQKLPNGCAIKRIRPGRTNCLAEESSITWSNGKIIQDMILRSRNMECGEIEIMLKLTTGPRFSVYGKDTFTSHDKMGDAQIIIKPFLERFARTSRWNRDQESPAHQRNCLSEESRNFHHNGKIVQDMILVLSEECRVR